jgi:predicted CXXCH cytochrome family protein
MKKLFVLTLSVFLATGAFAAITGSAHDFSANGWANNEICLPCHTPHNAKQGADNLVPLWNHDVTATNPFTLYSSPTGTLNAGPLGQPAGVSKACLSCHDGTIGVDVYGNNTPVPTMIAATADLGTDLSNDHPISFTYDTALATADGELIDPSSAGSSGLGGTIQNDLLFSDQMECGSCHDVHNTAAVASLLRKSNAASALCLTCHDK